MVIARHQDSEAGTGHKSRDGYSALAEVITRLSDDEAAPDETEKLVIALRRAEVIDDPTMVTQLGRYPGRAA
jgi:hypothetical protein